MLNEGISLSTDPSERRIQQVDSASAPLHLFKILAEEAAGCRDFIHTPFLGKSRCIIISFQPYSLGNALCIH